MKQASRMAGGNRQCLVVKPTRRLLLVAALFLFPFACSDSPEQSALAESTARMAAILERSAAEAERTGDRTVGAAARVEARRRELESKTDFRESQLARMHLSYEMLRAGATADAVRELEQVEALFQEHGIGNLFHNFDSVLASAYLRLGEENNCFARHGPDSCLLPIRGSGVHRDPEGSTKAIERLEAVVQRDPDDLAARWLLNLAYMTLGEYPGSPAEANRISPGTFASAYDLPRFANVASDLHVDVLGLAGGSIVDDFNGDGLPDLIASDWGMRSQLRYFRNEGDGTFADRTDQAGLTGEVGGLNIVQADYDNDGDLDFLVLRGAWKVQNGPQPNSLLRNNGDGSFTDVTEEAGLLSLHPTQVGVWGDFDNDGWLDLFIGNESVRNSTHPCELYRNNRDGTFRDVASEVGVAVVGFVKGAAWGDDDGWLDLYVSQLAQPNILFQNRARPDGGRRFQDVALPAGVQEPLLSFPTWFFDYDNDGRLDLFVGSFPGFTSDSLGDIAAGYLDEPFLGPYPRVYRNAGDGTFEDATRALGLVMPMLVMGANFGDLDNDGYLDIYLGTGEPNLATLVPNRMYRNNGGREFQNVTAAGGFGHLQKGHGISFADIDNDGDQDVYAVMGGAYAGDVAYNAMFLNPGSANHWITLLLEGVRSNRSAIGARVAITVDDGEDQRAVYAMVSSGGSFGASSLQQEIGLGSADSIVSINVTWPATGQTESFAGADLDGVYRLREGAGDAVRVERP